MSTNGDRRIGALGELPQDIAPARDLWPGIAAAIAAGPAGAAASPDAGAGDAGDGEGGGARAARRRWFVPESPAWALAAAVSCVAVGVWLGRASVGTVPVAAATTNATPAADAARAQLASYAPGARFERTRDALLADLGERLAQLPPETRARVEASLADVQRARADIQAALGRDPGNALLQEMLLNSYQDEMRVLTAVRETWVTGEEIGA